MVVVMNHFDFEKGDLVVDLGVEQPLLYAIVLHAKILRCEFDTTSIAPQSPLLKNTSRESKNVIVSNEKNCEAFLSFSFSASRWLDTT